MFSRNGLSWKTLLVGLLALGLIGFLPLAAVVSPPQQESTTYHIGTRLVEIQVVVRGHEVPPIGLKASLESIFDSGPPFGPPGPSIQGLTKEDFALFDDGKPQQISLFRAGSSSETKALPVPPGSISNRAVSNRQGNRGEPVNGVTVLLADFLNTPFDLNDYERLGVTKLLRSLSETDKRVAVYWLGNNLHILQDFTDDPHKLMADFAQMDQPHGHASPALASALQDYGAFVANAPLAVGDRGQITLNAMKLIIQHLGGMPGRKNLVWMRVFPIVDKPANILPKQIMDLLVQSNIALYPVVSRSVVVSTYPYTLFEEAMAKDLAEATGGRAFFDALDLPAALRTAEEDVEGSYVLGYYPAEEMLDGKHHHITVTLRDAKLADAYEFHYRTGYDATKIAAAPAPPPLFDLFNNPLPSTNIGLTGRATPDEQHAGLYNVELTVDLRDIHLDHKDGHFTGGFDVSVPNPSTFLTVRTRSITLDLPEAKMAGALENGGTFTIPGVEPQSGEIRVVVRDRANGVAGSLRIAVEAGK